MTTFYYQKLKWLKVQQMIEFHLGVFMYKIKHNIFPEFFIHQVNNSVYKNTSETFGMRNDMMPVPSLRTRAAQNSLTYRAVKAWNRVPYNIKKTQKLIIFKKKYKAILLTD